MAARHWVGIDQGFSQMGLAVLGPGGDVLASEQTREPAGDGHAREVALARLRTLLARVEVWRDVPVHLAGYCYEQSGVAQAFAAAGWSVAGTKGLNDVLGVYGLTAMPGNVVVAGCGTYSQVVYVDKHQSVRWPGDDVAERLPEWLLSGRAYSEFLVGWAGQGADATGDLRAAVRRLLGPASGGSPTGTSRAVARSRSWAAATAMARTHAPKRAGSRNWGRRHHARTKASCTVSPKSRCAPGRARRRCAATAAMCRA